MNITLADSRALRIESRYHPAIVERLKSIGAEWDKAKRCWFVPLRLLDAVIERFPKASYAYQVFCAFDALETPTEVFYRSLIALGVRFEVAGETVNAVGENVSPLLQQCIEERSSELLSLVNAQEAPGRGQTAQRSNDKTIGPIERQGPSVAVGEPTIAFGGRSAIVERGIVNAAQRSPRQYGALRPLREGRHPRRGVGRTKLVQGDLLRDD